MTHTNTSINKGGGVGGDTPHPIKLREVMGYLQICGLSDAELTYTHEALTQLLDAAKRGSGDTSPPIPVTQPKDPDNLYEYLAKNKIQVPREVEEAINKYFWEIGTDEVKPPKLTNQKENER